MTVSIPEESSEVVIDTLQKEIKRLKDKIESFTKELAIYEKKFNISSEEFIKKFDEGSLGDDQIFFEWQADFETYTRIKTRLKLLEKVKFD